MNTTSPSPVEPRPVSETFAIAGMRCGGCVAAVRRALGATPGVAVEHVAVGEACVRLDPAQATRADVEAAIETAGFSPRR